MVAEGRPKSYLIETLDEPHQAPGKGYLQTAAPEIKPNPGYKKKDGDYIFDPWTW